MRVIILILLVIVLAMPLSAQQNGQAVPPASQSTVTERMGDFMPPVRSTAVIKNIYADRSRLDITFEWWRYNPRFMQEIEENEGEIRRVIQYVLESKLYYYMRYNEPRLRKELMDALNAYFKYGQIDNLYLSGWPALNYK